jgi:Fe2+ transport system protein FeoA
MKKGKKMEVNLSKLSVSSYGYVSHIGGSHIIKRYLQQAGFTLGTKVVVLHISPYKSTYLLDVGGRVQSYRKLPLSFIHVIT